MKKIFEEYVESADYKISVFFKELKSQVLKWFSDGSLGAQGCVLDGDIEISNYNPMEKFLIFNFIEPIETDNDENGSYRYRIIFMVRIDQMKGKNNTEEQSEIPSEGKNLEIDKVLLKIHQFDNDNNEMSELVEEIDVEDIKEDFIIDKLGQIKDKSEDAEIDLKDNIYEK